ncbi:MAG: hypothetical protein JSU77_10720 [Fidelibacterota bacterium]|nr:MAG: hypothetical protein JSU77_10720 [Candidatus Neomarinimicrobiota bacterium]
MTLPRYKDIVDLIKQGNTAEAQKQILALREAALELQEENAELKEKIGRLEEELKDRLVFEKGVYYLEDSGSKEGPYCQRCYDKDTKLVRLQDDGDHWFCYGCSHGYPKVPYSPPV